MSQISTAIPATDLEPPLRRFVVNAVTEANRASTPKEITERRATKRMTLAEMNAADADTLRERLRIKYDERDPVTKLLDGLDLPRNLVANFIAPGMARKARERGDVGGLGLGKVTGSEVRGSIGVSNRIARGVGGFALDLAFDPLTYVGASPVAKLTSQGGKSVSISRSGMRALRKGVSAAAKGEAVRDPAIAKLIESAGLSAEKLDALRKSGGDSAVRNELMNA